METPHIRAPEKPLATPEDERVYVREQLQGKESEKHAETLEQVRDLTVSSPEAFPLQVSSPEAALLAVDLTPEEHDKKIMELALLAREKGISSAFKVLAKLNDPHVADDFHRYLVEFVMEGKKEIKVSSEIGRELRVRLFSILLPADKEEVNPPLAEIIASMEQFYTGMLAVQEEHNTALPYFSLEIAVNHDASEPSFYVAISDVFATTLLNHLLSSFPDARITHERDDYNIFAPGGESAVAVAEFGKNPIYPLRTHEDIQDDPLKSILTAFSKIKSIGEGAAVQFVINPSRGAATLAQFQYALKKHRDRGYELEDAINIPRSGIASISKGVGSVAKSVGGLFVREEREERGLKEEKRNQQAIEEIEKKIKTPIFETNIRIIGSADSQASAEAMVSTIASSFNQFEKTSGNKLVWQKLRGAAKKQTIENFSYRRFLFSRALPLNTEELATMMHFHIDRVSSAVKLKRSDFSTAPAPSSLSSEGVLLGINESRGERREVHFAPQDRLRHHYIIGQTGTGKSTYMKNLIIEDIQNGEGVCFVDPHGSDIKDVLAAVPHERWKDVIYFDPGNVERPMGLNMLEYDPVFPEQKTFVVNELFSIFQKLYGAVPESMGPMFEQYFRNATMLVIEDPESGSTLLDVSRVLADQEYRHYKLSKCRNPIVKQFWEEIAEKAGGEASLQNIVPYITSKFDVFLANDIMRPIVAQQESAFNFRQIMDNKKILLVNLSKGRLGEINANLLGLILVGKILMAALSRADSSSKDLPPFYLYIDEFQNITTSSISTILSEARKYKLSLTVAHQFMAQLQESIKDSILGNVGSITAFRIGTEDAAVLEERFNPPFSIRDMSNIKNYNAYVKLLVHGHPAAAFNILVPPPIGGNPEDIASVMELSYQRYGRLREEVEEEIAKRYK